jgi:hypothetical protein
MGCPRARIVGGLTLFGHSHGGTDPWDPQRARRVALARSVVGQDHIARSKTAHGAIADPDFHLPRENKNMALGELNERQRQLGRISTALAVGQQLTDRIAAIEHEIEPLQAHVEEAVRAMDFRVAAAQLEDGMNTYLAAINVLRPGVWRHSRVAVDVSQYSIVLRVGGRRWQAVLGGTDSLYFLMAYHYGLLSRGLVINRKAAPGLDPHAATAAS